MKFLGHRIADRRVLRLIRKWLSAGVIEDGEWSETGGSTAGSIGDSPNAIANFYFDAALGYRRGERGR